MKFPLGVDEIKRFVPHRAPILMLDRVLSIELPPGVSQDLKGDSSKIGTRVVAQKNISISDPVFTGHFPDYAIFPGVYLVEALAQTACFSIYPYIVADLERLAREFRCVLVGVDDMRFRKPVTPGDVLKLETVVEKCKGHLWVFKAQITVEGGVVAEGKILANLMTKESH